MGLLDKAMRTANDLAGKAETMLSQSGMGMPAPGGADRLYAELGRLVHEEHRGAPVDTARRADLLRQLDVLAEQSTTVPPPPGSTPPAPGAGTAYPSAGSPPPPPPPPPPGG